MPNMINFLFGHTCEERLSQQLLSRERKRARERKKEKASAPVKSQGEKKLFDPLVGLSCMYNNQCVF